MHSTIRAVMEWWERRFDLQEFPRTAKHWAGVWVHRPSVARRLSPRQASTDNLEARSVLAIPHQESISARSWLQDGGQRTGLFFRRGTVGHNLIDH